MRIFLVGGGSGGPTSPLLAVAEAVFSTRRDAEFFLIGTRKGIEAKLLSAVSTPITYLTVPAGKWRRYFSLWNLFDVFKIVSGFAKSFYLLGKYRPDIVFGAGSYVQVPVCYAAFLRGIPVVIHQQDRQLLLATRLVAPIAKAVTISFVQNKELPTFSGLLGKIPKSKLISTGNPVRRNLLTGSVEEARKMFRLSDSFPTILVMGGSQGSAKINQILRAALPELVKYVQIIHVTGSKVKPTKRIELANYHAVGFLGPELKHAYAAADLVIGRGGMSTITELSFLGKPAILIPLPKSPQEENVEILAQLKCAIGVSEEVLTDELLIQLIRKILWNNELQRILSQNIHDIMPHDADKKIARLLVKLAKKGDPDATR